MLHQKEGLEYGKIELAQLCEDSDHNHAGLA